MRRAVGEREVWKTCPGKGWAEEEAFQDGPGKEEPDWREENEEGE